MNRRNPIVALSVLMLSVFLVTSCKKNGNSEGRGEFKDKLEALTKAVDAGNSDELKNSEAQKNAKAALKSKQSS